VARVKAGPRKPLASGPNPFVATFYFVWEVFKMPSRMALERRKVCIAVTFTNGVNIVIASN